MNFFHYIFASQKHKEDQNAERLLPQKRYILKIYLSVSYILGGEGDQGQNLQHRVHQPNQR